MDIAEQYQAERDRIEQLRAMDWSTFTVDYKAAGESLQPMTVQVWFDLLAVNSPMVSGREPTIESMVDYVWRNSKRRTHRPIMKQWRLFWIQRRVVNALRKEESAKAFIDVILSHFKSNIDEFPASASTGGTRSTNALSMYSGEASMVDEIAERYSMHPDEVLELPLRKAFSLQRVIRVSTIPGHKILEPDSLRAIKSEFLNQINNGQK